MIGYTTICVSNMDSACKFYAALLGELGGSQLFGMDRIQFFGTSPEAPMLAVCVPYNEEAPAPGNGNMVAFPAGDPAGVDCMQRLSNLVQLTKVNQASVCRFSTVRTFAMQTATNFAFMK